MHPFEILKQNLLIPFFIEIQSIPLPIPTLILCSLTLHFFYLNYFNFFILFFPLNAFDFLLFEAYSPKKKKLNLKTMTRYMYLDRISFVLFVCYNKIIISLKQTCIKNIIINCDMNTTIKHMKNNIFNT